MDQPHRMTVLLRRPLRGAHSERIRQRAAAYRSLRFRLWRPDRAAGACCPAFRPRSIFISATRLVCLTARNRGQRSPVMRSRARSCWSPMARNTSSSPAIPPARWRSMPSDPPRACRCWESLRPEPIAPRRQASPATCWCWRRMPPSKAMPMPRPAPRLGLRGFEKACPLLVPLIEEGWTGGDQAHDPASNVTRQVLRIYLEQALTEAEARGFSARYRAAWLHPLSTAARHAEAGAAARKS